MSNLSTIREPFWAKTLDGYFYKKEVVMPAGKRRINLIRWNSRAKSYSTEQLVCDGNLMDTKDAVVEKLIASGWETDVDAADLDTPTVSKWVDWPEGFEFRAPIVNPNIDKLGNSMDEPALWAGIAGKAVIIVYTKTFIKVYTSKGETATAPKRILREFMRMFEPETIGRGVIAHDALHLWDTPIKNGVDLMAFKPTRMRIHKKEGVCIKPYHKLKAEAQVPFIILTDGNKRAEKTAYGVGTHSDVSYLHGTWVFHPTALPLQVRNDPQQIVPLLTRQHQS